jgi:hypothetical protein
MLKVALIHYSLLKAESYEGHVLAFGRELQS